ncbi:MAG: hypothetical protein ABJO09_04325 [Hyphomicrobiales bacterium]
MFRHTKDFFQMFAACNRMSAALREGGEPNEADLKHIGVTADRFKALGKPY